MLLVIIDKRNNYLKKIIVNTDTISLPILRIEPGLEVKK